jgi:hypothetical protein
VNLTSPDQICCTPDFITTDAYTPKNCFQQICILHAYSIKSSTNLLIYRIATSNFKFLLPDKDTNYKFCIEITFKAAFAILLRISISELKDARKYVEHLQ